MPINYSKYPPNWKSEIRPRILQRAKNKCECCKVPNYKYIFRGFLKNGLEVYQDAEAVVYDAKNSKQLFHDPYVPIKPLTMKLTKSKSDLRRYKKPIRNEQSNNI